MTETTSQTEDLWNSYTELLRIVNLYLNGKNPQLTLPELEILLRKHKQNFFNLLQNPPKNAQSRKELQKGMVDGITVRGIGHQVLSKELYQETIIISDMYDMNEFVALDLLCTAQMQMSYYPGLPRGLVAVLLYYDARKTLLSVLRMLVQARKGVLWCLNIRHDVESFMTEYTDELLRNGLFNRIFSLLQTLDLSKELEKLQQNVALGGAKHRRQVIDLFNEIRLILADIVFLWSSQTGLPKEQTLLLINYLQEATVEEEPTGKLDNVNLYLLLAFLASVDLSILHVLEDGEEVVQKLPIVSQPDFIETLLTELTASKGKWKNSGLQAVSVFGFAVCLASLRLLPQSQQLHFAIEQEEQFVDSAIELNVFEFLINAVLENETLYTEEFLLKRIHNLITDFIVFMYSKVKELRIKADDVARTIQVYANEGLEPPAKLPRYFEQLMLTIAKLYEKDPLQLELAVEFWSPLDLKIVQPASYRVPPRAVSLFKFMRLAGDVLPPTLFVPYLKMLKSLSSTPQTARYCFNMLKQAVPGSSAAVTWDHFFMSFARYYTNLHQEVPLPAETIYRRKNVYHKGITPLEVEGLLAVLGVIQAVAEHDDFSRLALCEHPGWAPINVLLGLVSCSIPIPLKAGLLTTLAALSKSSEVAIQMWENLEASQILVTVPSTSSYQPRGIQTELDEIETHVEEYPLTRALLTLLDVLVDSGIPKTLGAGTRKPGFDPYLNFILNTVLLKVNARAYKNPTEKWQVASLCLKLVEKFLAKYEPGASDFPSKEKSNDFGVAPGFHIMLQLNTKSELLNLILFIIDEGNRLFSEFTPFSGKKVIEECTLKCLRIIDRVLVLQPKFFSLLSASSSPVLLTNLSKLLLLINPRTGKPDHCITIASYMKYNSYIPDHVLVAVKILVHVTYSPVTHSQLMNILLAVEEGKHIKTACIDCLDNALGTDVNIATKEKILELLKQCLNYAAPNLSHFLLGFNVMQNISQMQFHLPGVLGFPRTCLHSLFSILKSALNPDAATKPTLTESAYHLLYLLSADSQTSEPVLRLLRLNPKFFKEHLDYCISQANNGLPQLNQLSWLLKLIAIEVKMVSSTKQISYLKELTNLLVDLPPTEAESETDMFDVVKRSPGKYAETGLGMVPINKVENLLSKIITSFSFTIEEVITPKWEYFDGTVLETILKGCETKGNPKLVDIKKLHQILIEELNTLQGNTGVGQRQAILDEIQKVLMHAVNINNSRMTADGIIQFVDAWRQVIEVIVTYVPLEILSAQQQQIMDIQMLDDILTKVVKSHLAAEIAHLLAGAVFLLLTNLRKSHQKEENQKKILSAATKKAQELNVLQMNANFLERILHSLVDWLISSDITEQKLRINLYGSLVTFLHLISVEQRSPDLQIENSTYVSRLDSSKSCSFNEKSYIHVDVTNLFGEKLAEVVSQDCIAGHEVCKMLSMASFSLLIDLFGATNWIAYLSGRGFLKHIIDSILQGDRELCELLEPQPINLKSQYLYESKMSLLVRIATTRIGAELILEQKLLTYLATMEVFDRHPEISSRELEEEEMLPDFIPSLYQRYLHLWLPALNICTGILTNLGSDNESAVTQILYFLLSHLNVIELVLKAAKPSLPTAALKEVAALTSLIARTADNNLIATLSNTIEIQNTQVILFRIEKLMLNLLPRFILNEPAVKDILSKSTQENSFKTSYKLLYVMQIISNILLYSRNLVANHDVKHGGVGVIFKPTLWSGFHESIGKQPLLEQIPSLGVVFEHLIHTVRYQQKEKHTYAFLSNKIQDIPLMNSIELKEFISGISYGYHVGWMREAVYKTVIDRLTKKKKEMEYCAFIIEHCIYLIWIHLDYYMLKTVPKPKNLGLLKEPISSDVSVRSALEATWKLCTEDVSNLKQGLVSIFNDRFSRDLMETVEDRSESDKGFVESLLRKIKRLVQFVPVK